MSDEHLLEALRAVAEPTRLRILALLSRAELTVTELTRILDQSQPRVSRHLKLMCEAGVLTRNQEGSWAFYRLAESGLGGRTAHALVALISREQATDPHDLERLDVIKAEHVEEAATYFRENAPRWDSFRALYLTDAVVEKALREAVGNDVGALLDMGTGTGQVLRLLGDVIERGIGVDASREMLSVARANLESAGLPHCQVRQGDLLALPVDDASMDRVVIHHVLHFLDDPGRAIAEAARVLREDGRVLVVDFAPHDVEALRTEHAHWRLGFEDEELRAWFQSAGLDAGPVQRFEDAARFDGTSLMACLWSASR